MRTLEANVAKLEQENRQLRDHHTSVEVLREEKRAAETRARNADELRSKVVNAEARIERLELEKSSW